MSVTQTISNSAMSGQVISTAAGCIAMGYYIDGPVNNGRSAIMLLAAGMLTNAVYNYFW